MEVIGTKYVLSGVIDTLGEMRYHFLAIDYCWAAHLR
jgi:hypothetical protein